MADRLKKVQNMSTDESFSVQYGITDKARAEVIYIKFKGNIKPLQKKTDYSDDVRGIQNMFNEYIRRTVTSDSTFANTFLSDLEISEGLAYGRYARLKCDIFLKIIHDENIIGKIEGIICSVSRNLKAFVEHGGFMVKEL